MFAIFSRFHVCIKIEMSCYKTTTTTNTIQDNTISTKIGSATPYTKTKPLPNHATSTYYQPTKDGVFQDEELTEQPSDKDPPPKPPQLTERQS
jgi:hypothetical protein